MRPDHRSEGEKNRREPEGKGIPRGEFDHGENHSSKCGEDCRENEAPDRAAPAGKKAPEFVFEMKFAECLRSCLFDPFLNSRMRSGPVRTAVLSDTEFEIEVLLHLFGNPLPEMLDVFHDGIGAGTDTASHRFHRRRKDEPLDLFGTLALRKKSGSDSEFRVEQWFGLKSCCHEALVEGFKEWLAFLQGSFLLNLAGRFQFAEEFVIGPDDFRSSPELFFDFTKNEAGSAPGMDQLDEPWFG